MPIHPTAVVSPEAELAEDVTIEAYSIIGPHVAIGAGTVVESHTVIDGWTGIGAHNRIGPFVAIGRPPQDLTYEGEETRVVIGDHNVIRENVSIHRGTALGRGVTRLGDHNYIMAYAHVAHDCQIGSHVILANAVNPGGHVQIDDHALLGGLVAVHQFTRIGAHAFVGGSSALNKDVPPYMIAFGFPARLYGLNIVGLRRKGFSQAAIKALRNCYRILFRSGLTISQGIGRVAAEVEPFSEVQFLLDFLRAPSKRGVMRGLR